MATVVVTDNLASGSTAGPIGNTPTLILTTTSTQYARLQIYCVGSGNTVAFGSVSSSPGTGSNEYIIPPSTSVTITGAASNLYASWVIFQNVAS